jgi:hypothetical protein
MSKKIVSSLARLILLLAAASLHARSNQMQVTVPFEFVAGGKTLPAGNMVELNTDSFVIDPPLKRKPFQMIGFSPVSRTSR